MARDPRESFPSFSLIEFSRDGVVRPDDIGFGAGALRFEVVADSRSREAFAADAVDGSCGSCVSFESVLLPDAILDPIDFLLKGLPGSGTTLSDLTGLIEDVTDGRLFHASPSSCSSLI